MLVFHWIKLIFCTGLDVFQQVIGAPEIRQLACEVVGSAAWGGVHATMECFKETIPGSWKRGVGAMPPAVVLCVMFSMMLHMSNLVHISMPWLKTLKIHMYASSLEIQSAWSNPIVILDVYCMLPSTCFKAVQVESCKLRARQMLQGWLLKVLRIATMVTKHILWVGYFTPKHTTECE